MKLKSEDVQEYFSNKSLDEAATEEYNKLTSKEKRTAMLSILGRYPDDSVDIIKYAKSIYKDEMGYFYSMVVSSKQIDILKKLATDDSKEFKDNLYTTLSSAVKDTQINIIDWVKTEVTKKELETIISQNNYQIFKWAQANDDEATTSMCLEHLSCFGYADEHDSQFGKDFVHPFVAKQLDALHQKKISLMK
jgi:Mg/Co/Ni transporter MgtE